MSDKKFCDICEKEFDPNYYSLPWWRFLKPQIVKAEEHRTARTYCIKELCSNCVSAFKRFVTQPTPKDQGGGG